MRIVMTGGTGFIGSHVVRELADGRNEIVVLARNPGKAPGLSRLQKVRVVKAPMEDFAAVRRHLKAMDTFVHIALGWGDTAGDMIRNETLVSVELLGLAAERGAKRILFTSSTAAVGYADERIYEDSFRRPDDFYGASKASVELFISAFARKYPSTRFNVIRPGYTFGDPCVDGGSTEGDKRIREICRMARKGRPIEVTRGDGTQFIWAGHLARLYRAVLEKAPAGEIYYGLSRNFITWEEIATTAAELAGSGSRITVSGRGGKPHLFRMDKVRKTFGLSFDGRSKMREHIRCLLSAG